MQEPSIDYAALAAKAPPTWVYKQDSRSRVWLIDTPSGPAVVKQCRLSPIEQWFTSTLGIHPCQREEKISRELHDKGIPVAPILASGRQWCAAGCRLWLMTPMLGRSVRELGRQGDLEFPQRRKLIVDACAGLTVDLIHRGYVNRDHQVSNFIWSNDGRLQLIDVDGVGAAKGRAGTVQMLATLLQSLAEEEIPPAERRYCLDMIRMRCEFLGPLEALAQEVDAATVRR